MNSKCFCFCYIIFSIFLLFLSCSISKAQSLDSLLQISTSQVCKNISESDSISGIILNKSDSTKQFSIFGYTLKNKGTNQICLGQFDQAIPLLRSAIKFLYKAEDLEGVSRTMNNLCVVYSRVGKNELILPLAKQQLSVGESINSAPIQFGAHTNIYNAFIALNQNDSALFYAFEGLRLADSLNNEQEYGSALLSIGGAHLQNKNYDEAYKYYLQSVKHIERSPDQKNLPTVYGNLVGVHTFYEQFDSAIYYSKKAIAINLSNNKIIGLAYNYSGIANAYFHMGNFEEAIKNNLLGLEISEKYGLAGVTVGLYHNLASCYNQKGKYQTALDYARKSIEMSEEMKSLEHEAYGYEFLSEAYEKSGQTGKALQAFKKRYELEKQFLNEEKNRQISEMQIKFETEKKNKQIETLSQQAKIQSLELSRRNSLLMLLGLCIVVLILVAYLMIQRRKAKYDSMLSNTQQKLLRTQMNPHFLFNSLMAIQKFLFSNEPKEAGIYMSRFAKLMRQILENSREDFISVADEVNTLENYIILQQLRFSNKFKYEIIIGDEIDPETVLIPPMFAQPFIENAIEHGFNNLESEGLLKVEFNMEGSLIRLTVSDNGMGIHHVKAAKMESKHKSLATQITKERFSLMRKGKQSKIGMKIDTLKEETGTKIDFLLPFSSFT